MCVSGYIKQLPTLKGLNKILKPQIWLKMARTSDGGNGNHSVLLPTILIKIKVNQMLPSSYISSLLISIL